MTTLQPIFEPTEPNPPRLWWTKRLLVWIPAALLAFALLVVWWHYEVHRRMLAEANAVLASRKPLVEVPDSSNAVLSLEAAGTILVLPVKDLDFLTGFSPQMPLDAAGSATLQRIRQANAPSLQLARLARFQAVGWKTDSNPVGTGAVNLGRTLTAAALYEHLNQNDAEAIEVLRDAVRAADIRNQNPGSSISHLLAALLNEQMADHIGVISVDLTLLPDSTSTTMPGGPASRQQIRDLIAELLDPTLEQGLERQLNFTRLNLAQALLTLDVTRSVPRGLALPVRPVLEMDALRILHRSEDALPAARATDYPLASSRMLPVDSRDANERYTTVTRVTRPLSGQYNTRADPSVERHFRALASRRIAAVLLAIRLYVIDHDGALPAKLDELVPAYLPALPKDPFAKDERSFVYRSGSAPAVYSVGTNGTDDGGKTMALPTTTQTVSRTGVVTPVRVPSSWDTRDAVFPLKRPRSTTAGN